MTTEQLDNIKTNEFDSKWAAIEHKKINKTLPADEQSLFVSQGKYPRTQRQLNLYYYFLFIKDILIEQQATHVMEVGCGRGTIALYLASYLDMDMTLLDSASHAIDIAKAAFQEKNIDATFIVGDATDTSLKDESYDAIVSIGLAEHLDNVTELFSEQYRLLKPGGVMVSLNIPKKWSLQHCNTLMRIIKKCFGLYKENPKKDYYRNSYTPKEYANFAVTVGFSKTVVTHVCPFPIYTPVSIKTDRIITLFRRGILRIRSLYMKYPYKTNYMCSQAHFLVAYK